MESRELRIGNWLLWEFEPLQVDSLDLYEGLGFAKPIPLTEEWLVKFGIKEWDELDVVRSNNFLGSIFYNKGYFYIYSGMGDCESYGFKIRFEYVHQLQNWWFANTGEELELNP